MRRLHRPVDEPIADAPDVDHEAVAARPQLLAQPARVRVERPRRAHRPEPPDVAEQLLLREHACRRRRQRAQQRELLLGQLDAPPAQPHLARRRVDLEVADAQPPERLARLHPPQDRRHAPSQLGIGERLRDEVVGAALEPAHAVELRRPPGHHDQRQAGIEPRRDAVGGAHARDQVEPRAVGQPEVDEREVGLLVLEEPHGVVHRVGQQDVESVRGEVVGEEGPQTEVVLDEQEGGGVGHAGDIPRAATNSPHPLMGSRPDWRPVVSCR